MKLWIVLDRLDVAFAESASLEANALRALFRAYLDLAGLDNISLKIFLRDDIWKRITESGFREASHITKDIRLTWNSQSLLNLIIRRALHNDGLREFYGVDAASVLSDSTQQKELFYRIFPAKSIRELASLRLSTGCSHAHETQPDKRHPENLFTCCQRRAIHNLSF